MIAGFHWYEIVWMYCAPLLVIGIALTEDHFERMRNPHA